MARQDYSTTFAIVLAMVLVLFVMKCFIGCAETLSPAEQAQVDSVASQIEHCKAVGREAGAYAPYDACMKEAGL